MLRGCDAQTNVFIILQPLLSHENLLTNMKTGFIARRFSWELASNLENVKRNIKYCKKLELNQDINRLRLNWQCLPWQFCDDKNQSGHTVKSYLVSDNRGDECRRQTEELWGKGGDFIGVSSNLWRQEEVNWGVGFEDELGSFRTRAAFLLVTRKPLMIPGLTGYP